MSEHQRLAHIEHRVDCALAKIDAGLNALHVLLRYALENSMSKLHEDLLAAAHALDAKVDALGTAADAVIASKTEGESQMADVLTAFEASQQKLDVLQARLAAAAVDNAGQGGSTGAGSGSGTAGQLG